MKRREATIRIENLVTGYKDKKKSIVITDGIDSTLHSGELTCLLGPNGAGKSTLLKTLSGFLPALDGNILVGGKDLKDYTAAELARVIGVVLTERITLNNMTVDELVAMGRSPYTGFWGHLGAADRQIVDDSISLVGIENLKVRMINTLSDGERQKVMIAKALAQETPVIFLDEPTAFLDYPSKVEIMQLLQNLARTKGKTVFMSTHDLELALQTADKIWLIDKQRGVKTGTPEDLSIQGFMGEYFRREGIEFDISTGLFRIAYQTVREMGLEGGHGRYHLVKKALARNGIRAGKNIECEDRIIIEDDGYLFEGKKYKDVESLLEAVL